ncbi:hypothetical protein BH20ACT9_BH20ACT9_09190 [soil metagenome]
MARKDTQVLTVRLAHEEYEAVRGYAFATDTSMNDIVRRALREFLAGEGREEEFEAFLTRARSQYRVALDKLADL